MAWRCGWLDRVLAGLDRNRALLAKLLTEHLLPLAHVVTPNLPEAELLLGRAIADPDGIEGFFPFGLIITVWALVSLWHLVLCMWGIVASGQGRELRGTGLPVWRASA